MTAPRRRPERDRPAAYLLGQAVGWLLVFLVSALLGAALVAIVRLAVWGVA